MNTAINDIAAERQRQIESEGWTPEHDDEHNGDLAKAAACYAAPQSVFWPREGEGLSASHPALIWPWERDWWKPADRRRELVKAGALIVAEIERLDRIAQ